MTEHVQWRNKKVIVTGGAGFIGSHLCERLIEYGAHVTVIDHLLHGPPGNLAAVVNDVEIVNHKLGGEVELPQSHATGDVLFHLAGLADPRACNENPENAHLLNVTATEDILKKWRGGPVIFLSSAQVYGDPKYLPIDENHPLGPKDPYAESKLAAERVCDRYRAEKQLQCTVIRNFNTYGPRQSRSYFIPMLIAQALQDKKISIWNGKPVRDLMYISDGIDALLSIALTRGAIGQTINLGSGDGTKMGDLGRKVAALFDVPFFDQQKEVIGSKEMVCDNSRLRQLTGWAPSTSVPEGIDKTVTYFRQVLGNGSHS